jgi:hypothetical protein
MAARVVLLHSPLVGPGCWSLLAPLLRARGHRTLLPDFTAIMRGPPPYYEAMVALARDAIRGDAFDRPTFLVAHSGAGALVPAIVKGSPDLHGAIFLDALLPHPGQSWFETASHDLAARLRGLADNGLLPPWHLWWPPEALSAMLPDERLRDRFASELRKLPLAYFEERAPETVMPPCILSAFIRLSDAYENEASRAEALGWRVVRETLHHLAMLTQAEHVAAVLGECTGGTG